MLSKIKKALKALKYILLLPLAKFFGKQKYEADNLWLISERGFDARDNGYWFYKFLVEKHPEIRAVYVADKNSCDYERVRRLGETVQFGSWQHMQMMCAADALISTHDCGWSPDMIIFHHLVKHNLVHLKGKKVNLQHGIMDKYIKWYQRKECKPDIFIVSSEEERGIMIEVQKHPEEVVRLTGMPRYDQLCDIPGTDNIIAFMPTWRSNLQYVEKDVFLESDYWKRISAVLDSVPLNEFLKANNIQLVFYPHIEFQKYIDVEERGNIRIASAQTDNIQDLMKRSAMLITDCSSIYFDFAYMHKPIIFYRWDEDFETCNCNGILIDQNRFGTVAHDIDAMISAVKEAWNKGAPTGDADSFFKFHDKNNCYRVYRTIKMCLEQ